MLMSLCSYMLQKKSTSFNTQNPNEINMPAWLDRPSLWLQSPIQSDRTGHTDLIPIWNTMSPIHFRHPSVLFSGSWSYHAPCPKRELHSIFQTYHPYYHQIEPPARLFKKNQGIKCNKSPLYCAVFLCSAWWRKFKFISSTCVALFSSRVFFPDF